MTESVKPNEQLADVINATKQSWRRDSNNLALSDQIQFSTIMRTFVDSTDQLMEVATAQSKVAKMDDERSRPAERDDFRSSVNEQRRAAGREVENKDRPAENHSERPKQAEKPKAEARDTSNDKPKTETIAAPKSDDAPVEKTEAKADKSFQEDVLQAQQPIVQTTSQQQQPAAVVAPVEQAVHQQATGELDHGAQSVLAGALTDKNFSRAGEDLHDAATGTKTVAQNTHTGGTTAANSLHQEQEADLTDRLAGMGQFKIQVDTGTGADKTQSNAFGGLNANVDFGSFDGLNAVSQSSTNDLFKGDGAGTGAEQKAQSTHANQPVETRNAAAGNAQDIAATFGAAMRAQAAMAGQANTTDVKPNIAPTEAIQSIGAAQPAGPSQLSQTAKANPTTAAHQPEKSKEQTAAEQIAVKIRQAVGDGTDKINIKLNPHELGRVEVRLETAKDGSTTVTVLADRPETLDMLQKDARGLERALTDAGLRTDAASLSFGLRGDTQRDVAQGRDRRNGSNNRNSDRAETGRIEFGDKAGVAKSTAYQRTLGADSGVDIRV